MSVDTSERYEVAVIGAGPCGLGNRTLSISPGKMANDLKATIAGIARRLLRRCAGQGERNHRLPLRGQKSFVAFCRCDVEAEHHPALVMLGDVAVRHPPARIRDVEQDVDGLASADEHR